MKWTPTLTTLLFPKKNLEDVILSEKQDQWKAIRSRECTDNLTANATDNFSQNMLQHTQET